MGSLSFTKTSFVISPPTAECSGQFLSQFPKCEKEIMGFTLFDLFVSSEGVEPKSVGPIIDEDIENPELENPLVWYTKPESRLFVVSVLVLIV